MMRRLTLPNICCMFIAAWIGLLACPSSRAEEEDAHLRDVAGEWKITYTNGAVRFYDIEKDGNMRGKADEQTLTGRVRRKGDILLLTFDQEDKLERLTLGTDGRLFVEHYDPKEDFPEKRPALMGVGVHHKK